MERRLQQPDRAGTDASCGEPATRRGEAAGPRASLRVAPAIEPASRPGGRVGELASRRTAPPREPATVRGDLLAIGVCALLAACRGDQPPAERPGDPDGAVIAVTATGGEAGGSECTLRDAIAAANRDAAVGGCPAGSGPDVVALPQGATVLLADVDNDLDGPNGLPSITSAVTVRGSGSVVARDPGAAPFRLFHVEHGGSLRLEDVTLRGGRTEAHDGGAVYVAGGELAAVDTTFEDNVVGQGRWGGAVYSAGGIVVLERVLMRGNSAPGELETDVGFVPGTGSAVANVGGELSVTESDLRLNGALISGERGVIAAIGLDAYTEVMDTAIVENDALGVYNEGELRLTRVEVARSASLAFGGVVSTGVAFLDDVALSANSAEAVSGLANSGFMRARGVEVTGHETFEGATGVLNEGMMELTDSNVSGNVGQPGTSAGGGITNRGRLTLLRTHVFGNSAERGGGAWNEGELVLLASVVDDNEAELGGGVYSLGTVELRDGSVVGGEAGNRASDRGGGVYVADGEEGERLVLAGGSAVRGNRSGTGGGVYAEAGLELGLCPTCAIEGNVADGGAGGGIHAPGLGFGSIFAPAIRDNEPDDVAPGVLVSLPVAASADDAEETAEDVASPPRPAGDVATGHERLDLRADEALGVEQLVGLRFLGVPVPPGATVVDARIVLTSATSGDGRAAVDVGVQDAAAAGAFAEEPFDLSSRPVLGATRWELPPWPGADESRPAQASPPLRNQLQQLVDADGWAAGNPVAVVLAPAGGDPGASRTAHSFDGDPAKAPRLWLLYYEPAAAP